MRNVAKFCYILAILLLVIATALQGLALFSVVSNDAPVAKENTWLVPCWGIALAGLPVAAVLCVALRKKKRWSLLPLLLAAVCTLLALLVALALRDAFPPQLNSVGETQGLTTWRLWYRHLSSVVAGGLIVLASALHLMATRQERIRQENSEYRAVYDLSGEPLFKDRADSTIGLDEYAEEFGNKKDRRRLKRSLRTARRKAIEQAEQSAERTAE